MNKIITVNLCNDHTLSVSKTYYDSKGILIKTTIKSMLLMPWQIADLERDD